MERIIEFSPAYDKRNTDPKKNYGIHGVTLRMVLKGPNGAVQFVVYTNWMLPHVQAEVDSKPNNPKFPYMLHKPMPSDLGYHSPKPIYEGQEITNAECEYVDGGACYYDGSTLNAKRIFDVLLKEGSDGVWRELEEYYNDIFQAEIPPIAI